MDLSAQNTAPLPTPSAGRASLTTNIRSKPGNALGNLDALVSLSAKVLSVSYEVDQVRCQQEKERGGMRVRKKTACGRRIVHVEIFLVSIFVLSSFYYDINNIAGA